MSGGHITPKMEQEILEFLEKDLDDRALNRLLTSLYPVIEIWAQNAARRHGINADAAAEDAAQLMALEIAAALSRARSETVSSWPAYLHSVARHKAGFFFLSPEFTGVPGSTGQQRRLRRLGRFRNELASELKRTPDASEILARHNEWVLSRRDLAGASKSGALASLAEARKIANSGV
jgi:hypothetical protein